MVITRSGVSLQVWFFESDEEELNKVFKFSSKAVKRDPKPLFCFKFPKVGKRLHSTQQDNHKTSISFSSFKQVFEMGIVNKPVAGEKPKTRKTDGKFN